MTQSQFDWTKAFVAFEGYLTGSGRAHHTIRSYLSDLKGFHAYIAKPLEGVTLGDFQAYSDYLKSSGFKTNSRRRKLLTLRKFFRFLTLRKKFALDLSNQILTPQKREVVPATIDLDVFIKTVNERAAESAFDLRNKVMVHVLMETGCRVSELTRLKFEHFDSERKVVTVSAHDEAYLRELPVSKSLLSLVSKLKTAQNSQEKGALNTDWLFLGHNRFGSLGTRMTDRGAELLVRSLGPSEPKPARYTPRLFRHSVVLRWFREGLSRDEIRKRLGLKTEYAFRVYEPLLKNGETRSSV